VVVLRDGGSTGQQGSCSGCTSRKALGPGDDTTRGELAISLGAERSIYLSLAVALVNGVSSLAGPNPFGLLRGIDKALESP
jgi:hypothetical protein